MKKPELLAPAGNWESLLAAIEAGCDAVYLSGYMFGARQFAANFSEEEIINAINLCHLYGVKVYVTVNTLIYEEEITTFLNYIDFLHKNNVDAVLIQDIGMLDLIRQTYPNLEVHASTQMHIHSENGIKFCEQMGIKRAVLARETSIDTIKRIKENTTLEIEVFVQGALCISYSGQCLMSSIIGGRSGNRGACAGSCRLPYKIIDSNNKRYNEDDYPLSTKDLCTLEFIGDLIDAGVDSLKIEGRMKRPEYVYLMVSLYRKAIDSYVETKRVNISKKDINDMKKIFNRGFTKGFIFNEENSNIVGTYRPNHLGIEIGHVINYKDGLVTVSLIDDLRKNDGIRIIERDLGCTLTSMYDKGKKIEQATKGQIISFYLDGNIKKGDTLVKTTDYVQLQNINQLIKSGNRKVGIKGLVIAKKGFPLKMIIDDNKNQITVEKEIVECAINYPLTEGDLRKQIDRLGNTIYKFDNLNIEMDSDIYVNNKELNNIRREAIELLNTKRLYSTDYQKSFYQRNPKDFDKMKNMTCLINTKELYQKVSKNNYKYIYIEDKDLYEELKNDSRVILKLPRVIENNNTFSSPVMISELGGLRNNNITSADFSLNVVNSYSIALLHTLGVNQITLSYELNKDQIERIISEYYARYKVKPNLELIGYSKIEAMVSKFNINEYYRIDKKLFLVDKFNNKYTIEQRNGFTYIIDYKLHSLNDYNDYFNIGINSIRLDFTNTEYKNID